MRRQATTSKKWLETPGKVQITLMPYPHRGNYHLPRNIKFEWRMDEDVGVFGREEERETGREVGMF